MIEILHANHSLMISGLLDGDDMSVLKEAFAASNPADTLHVQLHELDIEEGKPMAGFTALLKNLLHTEVYVRLDGPPQLLVHNLYRVGCYPHPCLQVDNMREDEPYG
ncbi:MAG: hypothetical protein KF690_07635 [Bacteroidetes bacterium]|nr:hypothetical protein [Bacteroidota bacterium]